MYHAPCTVFLNTFKPYFPRGLRALDKFSHSDPLCVVHTKVGETIHFNIASPGGQGWRMRVL